MALVPHKITALAESDADGTDGKNIIAGAIVSLFDSSGAAVTLFDDEAGSNGSTTKQTDSSGQVVVWVTAGEYSESVNGSTQRAVTIGGRTVTSYANTASLENSRPTQTGQRAENRERANAQYVLAETSYTAQIGDIVAANSRVWQVLRNAPVLVDSISELRALIPRHDQDIAILSSREDGGLSSGRNYKYIESSTATLNYENVITPLSGGGAWISISDKFVDKSDPQGGVIGKVRLGGTDKWSGKSINLLGDSISWGSNSPDVFNDSYCGVLRKFLQIEHQTESIGFVSILGSNTNAVGTYNDYHSVTTSGPWSLEDLADASNTINGMSRRSSSIGAYLDVVAPVENTSFRVMYRAKSTGGTFKVSNDGGATFAADVSTVGDDASAITPVYAMVNNGAGDCDIRIEVVGGDVEILGVQYFNAFDDVMFNNFSHPGRRIYDISTGAIDDACSGSTLVWSLGFNDKGFTDGDRDIVISKLNHMRDKVVERGIKLYIVDLNWGQSETNWLRIELIRVAREIDGATYIPFPELISRGGFSIGSGDLQTLGFLSDGAHPTPEGHAYVAETIAKNMGLSVSAKGLIEKLNEQNVNKGTFTPTVSFATNGDFAPTYTNQSGEYFVNGDSVKVILRVDFNTNAYTSSSGEFRVEGLPFQPKGVSSMFNYTGSVMYDMISLPVGTVQTSPQVVRNANRVELVAMRDGASRVVMTTNHFPASTSGFKLFMELEYPIV